MIYRRISFAIVLIINCLFCYKYGLRITPHAWLLTIIYAIVTCIIYSKWKFITQSRVISKCILITSIVLPLLVAMMTHLFIEPQSLNVDRWSVIDNFLNALFAGDYPYLAVSHKGNPPGPMPVYYFIALPFYAVKAYSALGVLGYSVLGFLLIKKRKVVTSPLILLTVLSVFMLWEITTLSNIFTYSLLCVLGLSYFENCLKNKSNNIWIACAVVGLMLSTRSVFSLTYVVFFISYLKSQRLSIKITALYSMVILAFFALTFLPFIAFYGDNFTRMNPFIVQSSFLVPQVYVLLFFVLAVILGFLARDGKDRFFYSGITLFIAICIYCAYQISENGLREAYLESNIDLSYFLFSVPFLIYPSFHRLLFNYKVTEQDSCELLGADEKEIEKGDYRVNLYNDSRRVSIFELSLQ